MIRSDAVPVVYEHGSDHVGDVRVDHYNLMLREDGAFVGDRVRSKAFVAILDDLRGRLRRSTGDPLGSVASRDRHAVDALWDDRGSTAATVIDRAIEAYASALADVVLRILATDAWRGTERIAVGGGLRQGSVGEEVVRRADGALRAAGCGAVLRPIRSHPDDAALLGAVRLAPPALLRARDGVLAVDIGGSNIRAGVVALDPDRDSDPRAAKVLTREHWCHEREEPERHEAVASLNAMLRKLAHEAEREGVRLAPFVGVACPGRIRFDGSIAGGAQNLPGAWDAPAFNLPACIRESGLEIGGGVATIGLHNDAVVQGLSEVAFMQDVTRWGILTIGTGLGNARFTNVGRRADAG